MRSWRRRLAEAGDAFWVAPAVCVLAAAAAGLLVPIADRHVTLPETVSVSSQAETARAVLTVIASIGVSVAGVSFSVITVALVLASQQLSPRVLRNFQGQRLNQAVLGVLLGTAVYALFVLATVSADEDEPVPELSVSVAMLLAAMSLGLFVVFLHHAVRSLNASVVIRRIAAEGQDAIALPYPEASGAEPSDPEAARGRIGTWRAGPDTVEVRAPRAGYVAAVDGAALVRWAARHDVFVEQLRGVGSFVVTNGLLAVVHGARDVDTGEAAAAFRLEEERVVQGDTAFPLRQLVDIALKGLSPGVNDPTTAENAMDSVADTLVRFARRDRKPGPIRVDAGGEPRLQAIAPTLGQLVTLGFDQVRRDGAGRPSFAVRLLELLHDIRSAAPAAAACEEIDRQARLIAEEAAGRASQAEDRHLIEDAFRRLHGR